MSTQPQIPIRPMDVGQILNRVMQLLRGNWRVLVGIACVPPAVMYALLGVLAAAVLFLLVGKVHQQPEAREILQILLVLVPGVILTMILYWLIFALYMAAGSHAAIQADRGVPIRFGEAYRYAWSRAGRYLLLLVIIYAICFIPAFFIQLLIFGMFGVTAMHGGQPTPWLFMVAPIAFPLQAILLVIGVIVALRLSLAFPASVVESLPAIEALKWSNFLTRGARLKIFLVLLVVYAVMYAVMLVAMCGAAFVIAIAVFAFSGAHLDFSSPVVIAVAVVAGIGLFGLMTLFMACSWAGFTTALSVIYNDQRRVLDAAQNAPPAGVPA